MASEQSEAAAAEQEAIVKEYKVENDDADLLRKEREWDDWKDGKHASSKLSVDPVDDTSPVLRYRLQRL